LRPTAGILRRRYIIRKSAWALMVSAVLAALVLADRAGLFGRAPAADVEKYHNKSFLVVRVVDGDTLDINCPDGPYPHTRIRLWGVDTPETVDPNAPVGHFGPQATRFTRDAALDQTVTLELDRREIRDKYGRLLAYVFLPDGQMLNRLLVEKGYGYADPRYDHRYKDEFQRLQRRAMRDRLGLWKDIHPQDLPYYYRDRLKLPGR
jgi:micrococcal nuclease